MNAQPSRRTVLALGAGSALAAPFVRRARAQTRTVYVNSYGGVWETSWRKAFFEPFTAQTRIRVKTVPGVSFAKLKAQVQTRNYEWDVVNIGDSEYQQATVEGLLDPVDKAAAKVHELPSRIVRDYAIVSYSLAENLVYRKDKFSNGGPQSWADFWDVQKFPGARCMHDHPHTCLAFALLADGVPTDKLYPMDVDRAFRKMDAVKSHIKVWWREGSQSQQLIRDGEVDIIAMWSARAVDLIADKVPLELVWNGARFHVEPHCAEGRPECEDRMGVLQFRGASEAPGGFRDAVALRASQSGSAGADAGMALAPDARLAGEREAGIPARCRLARPASCRHSRALEPLAHDVIWHCHSGAPKRSGGEPGTHNHRPAPMDSGF